MKPLPNNVIYYILLPILIVFLLAIDVFNFAAKIKIELLEYIRVVLLWSIIGAFGYGIHRNQQLSDLSIVSRLRYLLVTVGVLFLAGLFFTLLLSPSYQLVNVVTAEGGIVGGTVTEEVVPNSYATVLYTTIMFVVSMNACGVLLILLRGLIFHKQRRSTSRYYYAFLLFAALTILSTLVTDQPLNYRFVGIEVLSSVLLSVTTLLMLILSFRTSWIPYLSRQQKIAFFLAGSLIPGLMLIGASFSFSIWDILDSYSFMVGGIFYIMTVFLFTYSVKGVLSLLLHLPTAAMFDKKVRELNSLNTLGSSMNSVLDFEKLKVTITDLFAETLEADICWLELFKEDGNGLYIASKKARNPARLNVEMEEIDLGEDSISAAVIKTAKPSILNQLKKDKRGKFYHQKNIGSLMAVPLILYDEVVGILCAAKIAEFGFDHDDTTMFLTFANQATIAMENSRLIKSSIEKERLEQELQIAHEVQMKLLPQNIPEIRFARNKLKLDIDAMTIPASEVGGDYFDFVKISDWRIGLIIGDVSGKGTSASFYMAEIKGIIQSLAPLYTSPKQLLYAVNEVVYKTMDRKSFISLVYADFDLSTSEMTFARAGHCPPLVVTKDDARYLVPPGIALGIDSGAVFSSGTDEHRLSFSRDDLFVFYTDGVTESRNPGGQEFGEERLLQVVHENRALEARELTQKIVSEVNEHCTKSHDDLTLVIAKVVSG